MKIVWSSDAIEMADYFFEVTRGYFSTIMVKSLAVYIDHRLLKSITCGHHVGQARCEVG